MVAQRGPRACRRAGGTARQPGGAREAAGHHALLLAAAAHAGLHYTPDVEQAGAGVGVAAPGPFVLSINWLARPRPAAVCESSAPLLNGGPAAASATMRSASPRAHRQRNRPRPSNTASHSGAPAASKAARRIPLGWWGGDWRRCSTRCSRRRSALAARRRGGCSARGGCARARASICSARPGSGASPLRPSAAPPLSLPCPPVAPRSRTARPSPRPLAEAGPRRGSPDTNRTARIGPTVWDDEGPIRPLNRSRTRLP